MLKPNSERDKENRRRSDGLRALREAVCKFFPVAIPVMLMAGCVSAPSARSLEARSQIEWRLQEIFAAAQTKDFVRLDSYHLYGPKFTKFSPGSAARLDAVAGRQGEHDGLGAITGLKMRAEALKVDLFGDVAIATFILDYSFEASGATVQRKERSTLVFVKEQGEWLIAHEHLSPIQP